MNSGFHHHERYRRDDPSTEPFGQETPDQPGKGRGRRHRHGGGRGPGGHFGPGDFGPGGPGGFGPRGRRRRPKGAVRDAILSLLADNPANGYNLMKQISERAEGSWSPSPGSVYPTLAQLVDEGLITPTDTDRDADKGTDYTLTDAGREHVEANAEALAGIWADTAEGSVTRIAMRDSTAALMGVVQQYRFAATDEQRERAIEHLDETRRALYRILGE